MNRRQFIGSVSLASLGIGLESHSAKAKTHFLTLSFDDGFKKSFYRIAEIHEAYGLKSCLNVIATGHLPTFNAEPKWIPKGSLGDFNDWNKLKSRGHEIMPHTWDHRNLTQIPVDEAKEKIDLCFDYFEKNLDGYDASSAVYNFAYNASTPELDNYALRRSRAVRTGGWLVLKDTTVNLLPVPGERKALGCWGHGPDDCDAYTEETINKFLAGPGGWLILNLHGLDEEGWGPMTSAYLDGLLKRLVRIKHVDVIPAGVMLAKKR